MTPAGRLLSAALVLVCAGGVAACGSSDDGRSATAAAAVSQTYLDVSSTSVKLTASQASCLGTGIIGDFGINQAVTYGFLTKDLKPVKTLSLMLSAKDAGTYADLYLKCADPSTAIKNALIAAIGPKTSAAEAQLRTCLNKNLTPALLRKTIQAAASGDTSNATLSPLYNACGKLG